jgi:SAM-dependent methyltransferase
LQLTKAKSVTHSHLLSILNTEEARLSRGRLRLLDLGCGQGELLVYLIQNLPLLRPSLELECYGLDVSDSGMMRPDFRRQVIADLSRVQPAVDWDERISVIRSEDPWPYSDDFFDVIVSNQVIEHVDDHERLFAELKRTLKEGGYSVHLFPLKHCIWEPHVKLPFFHRVHSHDSRTGYIRLMMRLGLRKPTFTDSPESVDDYSAREADIMRDFTNYLSQRDVYKLGKRFKLRTSFRYTQEFYYQKSRSVAHRRPRFLYKRSRLVIVDFLSVLVFRYVAAVTLFLEKKRGVPRQEFLLAQEERTGAMATNPGAE